MTVAINRGTVVRAALADEWAAANPATPDEIYQFYVHARGLRDDLEEFHKDPQRREWTKTLVNVARNSGAQLVVDIGSGAGHDLRALRDAGFNVVGVEPNDTLRDECFADGFTMCSDVALAPIESANVLNCIDVLEHIPDPERWLGSIAERAQVGTVLLETCATFDSGTPLHLAANRGWAPGHCLQAHGWDKIGSQDRMGVWKRLQALPLRQAHVVVCASGSLSIQTHNSLLALIQHDSPEFSWRPSAASESGLLLARSFWASKWYRETNSDVFLTIDSDIGFAPQDAMHVVQLAREKRSIVVAAYPTRDGANLAIRPLQDKGKLKFGPDEAPVPIRWAGLGFMGVHRDVLDAMIPTLPLCDARKRTAHWPLFRIDMLHEHDEYQEMGEDYGFCEAARDLGFTIWLDPTIMLNHFNGGIAVNYMNMESVHAVSQGDGAD